MGVLAVTLCLGCGFVVVACGLGLLVSGFVGIVIVAFSCWVLVVRFVWYFRLLRGLLLVHDFWCLWVCGRLLVWCFIYCWILVMISGLLSDFVWLLYRVYGCCLSGCSCCYCCL